MKLSDNSYNHKCVGEAPHCFNYNMIKKEEQNFVENEVNDSNCGSVSSDSDSDQSDHSISIIKSQNITKRVPGIKEYNIHDFVGGQLPNQSNTGDNSNNSNSNSSNNSDNSNNCNDGGDKIDNLYPPFTFEVFYFPIFLFFYFSILLLSNKETNK